jgi:DNA-binding winged helix-turn-helix (wHTH) protein
MRLRFGDSVFDSDTREVFRGDRAVALSPKAFALLDLLIAARPAAVSKTDIHDRLWPGIHVSEANLANLVVELRAALGDDARKPRVIRTVPRFGYAFRAAARTESRPRDDVPAPSGPIYRLAWGRREFNLDPGENLIGRDRDAVVWIDDESVSRRHARISIGAEGASIEDLDSKNGTYLNGRKTRGSASLSNRDIVKIGPATLTVRVMKRTGSTRSKRSKGPR